MKHSAKITLILLSIFLAAQFIGIAIVHNYIDFEKSAETGVTEFKDLPIGERPPVNEKTSFVPVLLAVLIGTALLLLMIKFKLNILWKLWFLIAVVIALVVSFNAFIPTIWAVILAALLGGWKVFKPNIYIHNFTELFVYGGLAAIFVPLFNVWSVSILLVLISIYDAYAVWKSKHMITLAKSQTKAKVFAGLLIPYKLGKKQKKKKTVKVRTAMLGGGDIGFPLIFAGVILKEIGLWQSLIIPIFALLGLGVLLFKADEKKFYPAMPFISAGCFIGLGIILLLSKIL